MRYNCRYIRVSVREGFCGRVDFSSQDLRSLPSSNVPCFGFCFPPDMDGWGRVAAYGRVLTARAVIVVRDQQWTWCSMLSAATVRSRKLADFSQEGVFVSCKSPTRYVVVHVLTVGDEGRPGLVMHRRE